MDKLEQETPKVVNKRLIERMDKLEQRVNRLERSKMERMDIVKKHAIIANDLLHYTCNHTGIGVKAACGRCLTNVLISVHDNGVNGDA